ncbi:MAG: M20/M25/M40 family metallo-hydrolase [Microscillaceae bacterium]|nr:M20/M25/M40 family metallo-hydrolase [Microscillaceae bacterium]MDW8459788.1 M20/M25/M40 family metallo-hydrolase [Cytophagales bacterium]
MRNFCNYYIILFWGYFLIFSPQRIIAQEPSNKGNMYKTLQLSSLDLSQEEKLFRKIFDEALTTPQAYIWLEHLCKKIGGRLSGSQSLEKAVQFTKTVLDTLGLDRVFLQEVKVPHWVRGEEVAWFEQKGKKIKVNVCALGGSVPTQPQGIKAKVIEVKSFEELRQLGEAQVKGKIVFYNVKMKPTHISTFRSYGEAGFARKQGASEAAKYGAVGVIVRSLTTRIDDYPHTGSLGYQPHVPKIPAIAISTKDAELLSQTLKQNPETEFYFKSLCQNLPEATSHNVIGEIKGSEKPDEIIVVGGHLDSWDLGEGAHDDGTGCVQSMEVLRIFKKLGIKPKRTIRCVLFTNEENGVRGGRTYADLAAQNNEKHIFALESDAGGFTPLGFTIGDTPEILEKFMPFKLLFEPYQICIFKTGGNGADIAPLRNLGTQLIGFMPDSQRYFDHHHTQIDTFEHVNQRELQLGAAAITCLIYLLSEFDF